MTTIIRSFIIATMIMVASPASTQPIWLDGGATEVGDSPSTVAGAQEIATAIAAGRPIVSGTLYNLRDSDVYNLSDPVLTDWTVPILARVYNEISRIPIGNRTGPFVSMLYMFNSGYDPEWAESSLGEQRSQGYFAIDPGSQPAIGLSTQESGIVYEPLGIYSWAEAVEYDIRYQIVTGDVRPLVAVQRMPDRNVFDLRDESIPTVNCNESGAVSWNYQDDDFDQLFEPGEVRVIAYRLNPECYHIGLKSLSNTFLSVVVLQPDGSVVLKRTDDYDEPDDFSPTNSNYNYSGWGYLIKPGELAAETSEFLTVFEGMTGDYSNPDSQVRGEDDCSTCVRDVGRSARPSRRNQMHTLILNPRVAYGSGISVGALESSRLALEVSLEVAESSQISSYRTEVWRGSDMVGVDTLQSLTPANASTRWQNAASHTLRDTVAIADLESGEELVVRVTPLGRGPYRDDLALPDLSADFTVTVPQLPDNPSAIIDEGSVTLWFNPEGGFLQFSSVNDRITRFEAVIACNGVTTDPLVVTDEQHTNVRTPPNTVSYLLEFVRQGLAAGSCTVQLTPVYYDLFGREERGETLTVTVVATPGESGPAESGFAVSNPYPNPATTGFSLDLELSAPGEVVIQVYDALGRLVARKSGVSPVGQATETVDVGQVPGGAYLVRVIGPGGTTSSVALTIVR